MAAHEKGVALDVLAERLVLLWNGLTSGSKPPVFISGLPKPCLSSALNFPCDHHTRARQDHHGTNDRGDLFIVPDLDSNGHTVVLNPSVSLREIGTKSEAMPRINTNAPIQNKSVIFFLPQNQLTKKVFQR